MVGERGGRGGAAERRGKRGRALLVVASRCSRMLRLVVVVIVRPRDVYVAGWGVVLGPVPGMVPGSLRAGHRVRVRCGSPVRISNIDIESITLCEFM